MFRNIIKYIFIKDYVKLENLSIKLNLYFFLFIKKNTITKRKQTEEEPA